MSARVAIALTGSVNPNGYVAEGLLRPPVNNKKDIYGT
jgi:hypothetical protein